MRNNQNLAVLLKKILELEKKCRWLKAAELYEKASSIALKNKDLMKAYEFLIKKGNCYFRAANQAESITDYRSRVKLAIKTFKLAYASLEKCEEEIAEAKKNHAKARISLMQVWLARLSDEPKKISQYTSEWWNLENQALHTFEKFDDIANIGMICNNLIELYGERQRFLKLPSFEKQKLSEDLINYGEKAIEIFTKLGDEDQLNQAYNYTSLNYMGLIAHPKNKKQEASREQYKKKCLEYAKKGLELSNKTGSFYYLAWGNVLVGFALQSTQSLSKGANNFEQALVYSETSKDQNMITLASRGVSNYTWMSASIQDDPEKKKLLFKKALEMSKKAILRFKKITYVSDHFMPHRVVIESYMGLASVETDLKAKQALLKKATAIGSEGFVFLENQNKEKSGIAANLLHGLADAFYCLAMTKSDLKERKELLNEALKHIEDALLICETFEGELGIATDNYHKGLILSALAKLESRKAAKLELLTKAVSSLQICTQKVSSMGISLYGWAGRFYYWYGRNLDQLYTLTKDNTLIEKAIKVFQSAVEVFKKLNMKNESAESYWQIALIHDRLKQRLKAAENYTSAAEHYQGLAEKIPKLRDLYNGYSYYMNAWSHIEKARYNHEIEEYNQSKLNYENAAHLLELSESWNYLSPNYFAWARVEDAEALSRKEKTLEAKSMFKRAIKVFEKATKAVNMNLDLIQTPEEKDMAAQLIKASDLKRKYCEARIDLEEAKILERKGNHYQSSRNYGLAAEKLRKMVEDVPSKRTRRELKLILTLCLAWQKMVLAEEKASSQFYYEASELFEQAKSFSITKRTSLWASGNSSFCKGLAAGLKYQDTLELETHSLAKGHMKSAANHYLKAGFQTASEYARATQRLFDAYLYMNRAETENDPEKMAKYYQMAEKVLLISAGAFTKAKQPEKRFEVQRILEKVREEKELASSLNEVFHAPTMASTTLSFTTPIHSNGEAVGLERFEHANVQANLIAHVKQVKVGESFCLSIEFVNMGKEPALLTRIDEFVPKGFLVVEKPEIYRLEDSCLNMRGRQITPLKLVEAKLVLQPSKKGVYQLKPKVHYLDEFGRNKSIQLKSVEIKVEEVILSNRFSTGTKELDSLLLGGIPEEYAVVLTGPPSDERQLLTKNFLEVGVKEGQPSFYVTTEATGLQGLLEKSDFYLFLCNPKPKVEVPDLPNVYRLRSKTALNNINIALAKAYKNLDKKQLGPKRILVEIVSDVLLDYGAKTARKWIAELITDLGSKGFTLLAVVDSSMHPVDQVNAVLNLFDGEICLFQTEDPLECKRSIRVKKLRNQDYIKNPICLTNQK